MINKYLSILTKIMKKVAEHYIQQLSKAVFGRSRILNVNDNHYH